jgi:hypothetical protein
MSRPSQTLALHEEVLLLALRNDKGTIAGGVGKATKQAIEAVQAAIMVAAILPATIAATTH